MRLIKLFKMLFLLAGELQNNFHLTFNGEFTMTVYFLCKNGLIFIIA